MVLGRKKSVTLFAASFITIGILTTHRGGAQTLRLDDVFAPEQPAAPEPKVSDLKQNPARAHELLAIAGQKLNAKQYDDVLTSTELLTAVLAQDSTEYGTALWLRARAYEGLGASDKVLAVADVYIRSFPKGENRGWFLLRVARAAQAVNKKNDARMMWRMVESEKYPLSPLEALEGAELLTETGDGATARALLEVNVRDANQFTPKDRNRYNALLTESLLVSDDVKVKLPEGTGTANIASRDAASAALRRAMLMEIRGEKKQAQEEYLFLQQKASLLSLPEQQLLEDRIAMTSQEPWPPPPAMNTAATGAQPNAPAAKAPGASDAPVLLSPTRR